MSKNKVKYIVNVEVGNTDEEKIHEKLMNVKNLFQENGIENAIYVPTHNGIGTIMITKL